MGTEQLRRRRLRLARTWFCIFGAGGESPPCCFCSARVDRKYNATLHVTGMESCGICTSESESRRLCNRELLRFARDSGNRPGDLKTLGAPDAMQDGRVMLQERSLLQTLRLGVAREEGHGEGMCLCFTAVLTLSMGRCRPAFHIRQGSFMHSPHTPTGTVPLFKTICKQQRSLHPLAMHPRTLPAPAPPSEEGHVGKVPDGNVALCRLDHKVAETVLPAGAVWEKAAKLPLCLLELIHERSHLEGLGGGVLLHRDQVLVQTLDGFEVGPDVVLVLAHAPPHADSQEDVEDELPSLLLGELLKVLRLLHDEHLPQLV
mmetsp:Transcript_12956/g.30166  ORF Transcript_12956/g.30166 Transcript_12956/m.30166 type:complete len:317 (+) Transcript_12956:213-1163(+)